MPMKQDRKGYGSATTGSSSLAKGPKDFFRLGDWNARCDQCYQKIKASEARLRWDNMWVCWRCWEIRNPQDFVKGVPDKTAPPWTRPTPPPTFVSGSGATGNGYENVVDGSDQSVGGPMPG